MRRHRILPSLPEEMGRVFAYRIRRANYRDIDPA